MPLHKLTGFRISKVGKQEIVTNNFENASFAAGGAAIRVDATGTLQVVKVTVGANTSAYVSKGKHNEGFIVWEVPADWKKLKVTYKVWTDIDGLALNAELSRKE